MSTGYVCTSATNMKLRNDGGFLSSWVLGTFWFLLFCSIFNIFTLQRNGATKPFLDKKPDFGKVVVFDSCQQR